MFDLSYLYFWLLPLLPRKFKVIYWGIGVSASYNNRYDEDKSMDNALLRYIKYSDACVFYSSYPVKKYTELGVSNGKLFVANNTVQVLTDIESNDKTNIIFVGSLYKQKKIHELLVNYLAAYNERHDIPNLIIIGEGDEYETIKKWILDKELDEKIELKSAVYNEKELSSYFASAIVCISPDQAGLTVLKSMGYGVPFVTMHNSITGGEIFNIEDGVNGLLIKSFSEIKSVILDTCTDKEKFIRLGLNAKDFYNSDRTVEKMVDGFEQSINYVLKEGG
jgi:glycosyltransferase involved in cell wall biosynthesis